MTFLGFGFPNQPGQAFLGGWILGSRGLAEMLQ